MGLVAIMDDLNKLYDMIGRKELMMIAGVSFVTVLCKTNTLKFTFEGEWLLGGKKLWGRAQLIEEDYNNSQNEPTNSQNEDVATPESDGTQPILETTETKADESETPVTDGVTEPEQVTGEQVYKLKFSDIAIERHSIEELKVILDIMAKPSKYKDIGCVFPLRYVIVGPSEHGKTLHSMALLGEAEALLGLHNITFINGKSIKKKIDNKTDDEGTEIIEIFKTAKKNSLSTAHLIVIDNIDEFEHKKVLNLELANLNNTSHIIVIMTAGEDGDCCSKFIKETNCIKIRVNPMTQYIKHREEILRLHLSKTPLGSDIDVSWLAMRTYDCTAGDLANLAANAARYAAYRGKTLLTQEDLEWIYKVYKMPTEKLKAEIPTNDSDCTAYHECGHAAILHLYSSVTTNGLNEIQFVSIEPSYSYLGCTQYYSKIEDALHNTTRKELLERIDMVLGGRAAEEILSGKDNMSTGISADMSRATHFARNIITLFDVGKDALYYEGCLSESDKRKELLTLELNKLLDVRYKHVLKTLKDHWPALERTVQLLLKKKIITGEEFKKEFDCDPAEADDSQHEKSC